MTGKGMPRLNLAGASTGQKVLLGVVVLLVLVAVANGGDSEADETARPRTGVSELAGPIEDRGPRLTYSRRSGDFEPAARRTVPDAPDSHDDDHDQSFEPPPPSGELPRLTYQPNDDSAPFPPAGPTADSAPPRTVQQTSESPAQMAPAAPAAAPGGGAPGNQLARTGAAAGLTAIAGIGLIYTGTSIRDRIRRARLRPYGRTVPRPGEGRPAAHAESLVLKERPK